MSLSEFQIIETFFKKVINRQDVLLGIGDDCALLTVPAQHELAVSMDTLVAGTHFFTHSPAKSIGYKALAVNLSDLAAMGANPAWATLSLTMPTADEAWLKAFCEGFFQLMDQHHLTLIGGDMSKGPLSITVQVHGFVPSGQALRRAGAKPGDNIYVTGTLGAAGLAVKILQKILAINSHDQEIAIQQLDYPQARIQAGIALRSIASSAIDISDGLAADLTHILDSSQVGATLFIENLPIAPCVSKALPYPAAQKLALSAGDDYELCFTAPPEQEQRLKEALKNLTPYTKIGVINKQRGLTLLQANQQPFYLDQTGHQHF